MGVLLNFLVDNYIYFIFGAILLVLALIGYIVDSTKDRKVKAVKRKENEEKKDIPIATLNSNVKFGGNPSNGSQNTFINPNLDSNNSQDSGIPPVQTKHM